MWGLQEGPSSSTEGASSAAEGGPVPHLGPPMAHSHHDMPGLPPPPSHAGHSLFGPPLPLQSPTLQSPRGTNSHTESAPSSSASSNVPDPLAVAGLRPHHLPPSPVGAQRPGGVGHVMALGSLPSPPVNNGLGAAGLLLPPPVTSSSSTTTTTKKTIKSYHCKMCDQIFDNKSDALLHNQTVHKADPKPYRCGTCAKTFANSSYLSQHSRIHAGVKPYKCQICERRFTQLCHLQQHIRTHTGEKPYSCQHPGCAKAFSQLSNLQSHSRSHMSDRPFRCNSCYKCFTDEQALREHIPKHSETKHLKTHICRICGKSYTQETYLARHMTKHQGADPAANMLDLTSLRQHQPAPPLNRAVSQPAHSRSATHQPHQQDSPNQNNILRNSPPVVPPASQTQMPFHHSLSLDTGAGNIAPACTNSVSGGNRLTLADIPDIKPFLEGAAASLFEGPLAGMDTMGKGSSAFMPLPHQFPGQISMTSVPSNFPFPAPNPQRFTHSASSPAVGTSTPLSPPPSHHPLTRLSPPLASPQHHSHHTPPYFPFDTFDFSPKRNDMDGRVGVPQANAGVLASSLLRLQQIRQFSSSHPVFPKGEPSRDLAAHANAHHKNFGMHKDYP